MGKPGIINYCHLLVQPATTEAEDELAANDVYGFLAKQMHKEAGKNQEALKQDVMKACLRPPLRHVHGCL